MLGLANPVGIQNHAPRFLEDRFRAEPLPVLDIEIAIQILDAAFPLDHEISAVILHCLFVSCQICSISTRSRRPAKADGIAPVSERAWEPLLAA